MYIVCVNLHKLHKNCCFLHRILYLCTRLTLIIEMELMQFSAVVLLTLLTLKLLLLPKKVAVNAVMDVARWMMVIGILLLDVQFLLQFKLGLRAMGVTQAVLLNLVLFIPSSWLVSLAMLYLQRQGRITMMEKVMGGIVWLLVLAMLGVAAIIDGQSLWSDTLELHRAEVVSSILYLIMQGYYTLKNIVTLRAMHRTLQNYYDRDTDGMLCWMRMSSVVLMVMAIMVPLLMFVQSKGLALFAIIFFSGIFFQVDSFCSYVVSAAPMRIKEAEDNEEVVEHNEKTQHTYAAIKQWIANGGYRQNGLTMPAAAESIGMPRYALSAWLRQHDTTYANWMTDLRIEEAKRVIKEHPDWNNEAIADHCGFSDRSYFQRKFKEKTGITPSQYSR